MLNGHLCSFSYNMHVKQYDYDIIKIKSLKISKSVNLSLVNWERYSLWATSHVLLRHTLVPMSSWFGSPMVPCDSLSSFVDEVRE